MPPNPKEIKLPKMSSSPPSELSPAGLNPCQNPRNWRFTWEAQSHIPTVKLYLFNPIIRPATQCSDLKVKLIIEQSSLLVSFTNGEAETSLRVPLPNILIDNDSPVHFKAHDDHIEVKLLLLLPVDHPIVTEFGSTSDDFRPLSADSDQKKLSALEEVYFYCRSCSTKLTRPLRSFKELPSVNWQDVADNWFGSCCCSFGGVGEKLVTSYAKSYTCVPGVCLLENTAVIICKDDLIGCESLNWNHRHNDFTQNLASVNVLTQNTPVNRIEQGKTVCLKNSSAGEQGVNGKESHICSEYDDLNKKLEHDAVDKISDRLSGVSLQLQDAEKKVSLVTCSTNGEAKFGNCDTGCCRPSAGSSNEQKPGMDIELLAHQKILLDGFIWNGFMARTSNLSKDVQWVEFLCPHCSCLLGAYPCFHDNSMLDGGVRLFKCQISTCLPGFDSNNCFRCYSLERMFSIQLLESAKEELSFRTVVRDVQTNQPMLQLVLLNPDSWCYTGCCLCTSKTAARTHMCPTVKILFSACSKDKEVDSRKLEEQISKNEVEELYMLPSLIKELITLLESANSMYALQTSLQGLLLSSLKR